MCEDEQQRKNINIVPLIRILFASTRADRQAIPKWTAARKSDALFARYAKLLNFANKLLRKLLRKLLIEIKKKLSTRLIQIYKKVIKTFT